MKMNLKKINIDYTKYFLIIGSAFSSNSYGWDWLYPVLPVEYEAANEKQIKA
jgi:hypothetical protein